MAGDAPRQQLAVGGLARLFGVAMLLLIAIPPTASAERPSCFGQRATIVGNGHGNRIMGTGRKDVIVGLGGKDVIHRQRRARRDLRRRRATTGSSAAATPAA